ncbi:arginase [Candidatus Odyssella acanthamoebae]|uniref:arginase n=1 Tax=Candidatus Odyssella acanthamoebae TaxID=91604 RepID=UPI00068F325B|nr:arginase [Candidatus Paracaedibacter acanthamoebae]
MSKNWALISASSGWGASNMGTGAGAYALFHSFDPLGLNSERFDRTFFKKSYQIDAHPDGITVPKLPFCSLNGAMRFTNVLNTVQEVYEYTVDCLGRGFTPFVLGGDHSIAIGTWSAMHQHYQKDFGLIWIDAHLDSHTPETSPSQARHGMPLAALIGQGDCELTSIGSAEPKLKPENLVIIGARSFEEGEQVLLEQLGVRVMYMDEVRQRGFRACFEEAVTMLTKNGQHFGISFDVDAFDPLIAPGTGAAEPNGLLETDVLFAMEGIFDHDQLLGFELVEFNPTLDIQDKTLNLIWRFVYSMMGRKKWKVLQQPQQRGHG